MCMTHVISMLLLSVPQVCDGEDHTHTSVATVSFSPEPEMEVYGEVIQHLSEV